MHCFTWQGGRSTLLNFQLTDNKNNIVYRLSAEEEEGSAGADLESKAPDPISDGRLVQRQSTSGDRLVGTDCASPSSSLHNDNSSARHCYDCDMQTH